MANEGGPWGRETPAETPAKKPWARKPLKLSPNQRRLGLWLLVLAAILVLVFALNRAFPEAVRTQEDWSRVIYGVGLVALISAGVFRAGRGALTQHLRHVAIWTGVAAVLVLGFAYREELAGVGQHVRLAFSSGNPVITANHQMVIPQDDQGAFMVIGKVNGQRVRFMVDTGASDTVLSPDDARRLGVDTKGLRYLEEAETANGKGYGAPFAARSLEVGPVRLDDFRMTINQAPMSSSLLGLSFLNRLASFEIRGRKLILTWRDG